MADLSAIEWTGATWNPVTGCTRVSPGCARCYIDRTPPFRIAGRKFRRVGNEETTGVLLHPERLDPEKVRKMRPLDRPIFVCSLSDLFHEAVPDDYVRQVFAVMAACPERTFQVLTKRPERARYLALDRQATPEEVDDGYELGLVPGLYYDEPHPNVWFGVSVENARYTQRVAVLRQIPAAVRFVSAEPLLGSLLDSRVPLDLDGIDWIIVGGESGPGARPMRVEWAREIRDECLGLGHRGIWADRPAFFFKQWGGKTPKAGGRELDGREWNEMPERVAA